MLASEAEAATVNFKIRGMSECVLLLTWCIPLQRTPEPQNVPQMQQQHMHQMQMQQQLMLSPGMQSAGMRLLGTGAANGTGGMTAEDRKNFLATLDSEQTLISGAFF